MMEKLNRYFFVVAIAFVVICAYLTSGIVVQAASHKWTPRLQRTSSVKKATQRQTAKPSLNYYSVILNRNIFNSAHNPLEAEEAGEVAASSPSSLKLLGTVAWTKTRSIAVIEDKTSRKIDVYKVGDKVGGYEVVKIERGRVYLASNGKQEVLELPDISKTSGTVAQGSRGKGRSRPFARLPMDGIKRDGNRFEVDHSVIEKALGDMGSLLRHARVVPYFKDGKVQGFKIFRIRKGSLYEQIGLNNGDIIQRINGVELTGPEQALQLFEILRNERQITVDIIRNGRHQTLSYTIR